MTELLDRAAILAADDIEYVDVDVRQWGKRPLRLRSLTLANHLAYEKEWRKATKGGKHTGDGMIVLLSWCIVNKDGEREFPKAEELLTKSLKVLVRLFDVATTLNSIPDDEELEKNSPAGDGLDLTSPGLSG